MDPACDAKVLDIGTGLGAMSILLVLRGHDLLTGEPEGDAHSHQHHESHSTHDKPDAHGWRCPSNARALCVEGRIRFRPLNAEGFPFPDDSFDALFMYDASQHIDKREIALGECLRVARHDGVVCVIEWTQASIEANEAKYGFRPDCIDPNDYVDGDDVSIELFAGKRVHAFVLRAA